MRILITGARSPVARRLIAKLLGSLATEWIVAVGKRPPPAGGPRDPRLVYIQADLSRSRERRRVLFDTAAKLGLESLVHGPLHAGARSRRPDEAYRLNVEATRELVHLAERHPSLRQVVYLSSGQIYRVRSYLPMVIDEAHPLELAPEAPSWIRERVEADLVVSAQIGLSPLRLVVLRPAETLCPGLGSQLYDYLMSRVCFRPLGFDPMLNLLSLEDRVEAVRCALAYGGRGVFNIAGADTLPLSAVIARWGRRGIGVPGPLLSPLYRLRTVVLGTDFRYDLNRWRFHYSAVLDGTRAERELGYRPCWPMLWPKDGRPQVRLLSQRCGPAAPTEPFALDEQVW